MSNLPLHGVDRSLQVRFLLVAVPIVLCLATVQATNHQIHLTPQPSSQPASGSAQSIHDLLDTLHAHGWHVSTSAYDGLPDHILARDLARLATAVKRHGGTFVPTRDIYAFDKLPGQRALWRTASGESVAGPDGRIPLDSAGVQPVPIRLLPDPGVIRSQFSWPEPASPDHSSATRGALTGSSGRQASSLPQTQDVQVTLESSMADLAIAGKPIGRSLLYTPGVNSDSDYVVAHPQSSTGRINTLAFLTLELADTVRAVTAGHGESHFDRIQDALNVDGSGGATLAARLDCVGLNSSVYLVEVRPGGEAEHAYRFIAFPFADAWPIHHARDELTDRKGPAAVKLVGPLREPMELGRSLLVVPRPAVRHASAGTDETVIDPYEFPPTLPMWGKPAANQERLVIPESFASQSPAIAILKDQGWTPLDESYVMAPALDADLASSDIRALVIFGNITDQTLQTLVSRLQDSRSTPPSR